MMQSKSYLKARCGTKKIAPAQTFDPDEQSHWKAGGQNEETNRDHRREAPAGSTEPTESLN
jgi:hypothetical protein